MYSLRFGGSFNWGLPRRPHQQKRGNRQLRSGDGATATGSETLAQRIGGISGLAQAAVVAGGVAGVGNLVAQAVVAKEQGGKADYDLDRMYRMAGVGALLVGPYQHLLFSVVNSLMPTTTLPNVIFKTALSSVALAPAALAFLYAWNLVGPEAKDTVFSAKVKHDLTPSTMDGWRLWLPAVALNFLAVPASAQVFFTTACTALWATHESPAKPVIATTRVVELAPLPEVVEAAPEPVKAKAAKKSGRFDFDLNDKKVTVSAIALWIAVCVLYKKD